jgi:hypothetical protein
VAVSTNNSKYASSNIIISLLNHPKPAAHFPRIRYAIYFYIISAASGTSAELAAQPQLRIG